MLADYTKDGRSLIAAAKLLLHEFFHGIRLKDRPDITAPWMLLEEQMMLDDSEWRTGQMARQVSDRKAVIYNILKAIPMEPRKPGDPIIAPSDADQERAIAEVIQQAQASHKAKQEAKQQGGQQGRHQGNRAGQASKASKWSLEGLRREQKCITAAFEKETLGWDTKVPAMLAVRRASNSQAGPCS